MPPGGVNNQGENLDHQPQLRYNYILSNLIHILDPLKSKIKLLYQNFPLPFRDFFHEIKTLCLSKNDHKAEKTRQGLGRHVIKSSVRDFDTVNCEDHCYLISKYLVDMGFWLGWDGRIASHFYEWPNSCDITGDNEL